MVLVIYGQFEILEMVSSEHSRRIVRDAGDNSCAILKDSLGNCGTSRWLRHFRHNID